jgi:hypothetical protein
MTAHTITPRKGITSTERYSLTVSAEDYAKMSRGERWAATMTDIPSGKQYHVTGAPCGISECYCDALATPVVEARTETIYHDVYFFSIDDLGEAGDGVVEALSDLRDLADRAIELLQTDGVELIDVYWDKHPTGYGLVFETTNQAVAREQGFWDMLLAPSADEDEDELDWEMTPWKREAEAYRALIKAVGEPAAKVIGADAVAKFPGDQNETQRAEAYEAAAKELAVKETA